MMSLRRALRRLSARGGRVTAAPFAATRTRLVLINLGVVSAIIAVMAIAVFAADAHAIDSQIDQQLLAAAAREQPLHATTGSPASPAGDQADLDDQDDQYEPTTPNVFTVVLNPAGHPITDPGHVGALVPATVANRRTNAFLTVTHAGHTFRLYIVPVIDGSQLVSMLQIGMSLDARDRQLRDLVLTLVLVGIAMLILTALASVFLAERALIPTRLAFERQRQFSAAAGHELRTPLAIARAQIELVTRRLRRSARSDLAGMARADLAADLDEALIEVDYMARLISDLSLLARAGTTPRSRPHTLVSLSAVTSEVTDRMQEIAATRELTLALDPLPDQTSTLVQGDPDRVRQLVIILLDNALRYTPPGGSVRVAVTTEPSPRFVPGRHGQVRLSVADTGAGIAPEHLERIFEPFFRVDLARTNDGDQSGSGLGLALARWIVDQAGGTLEVESTVGAGSTFTITLPLANPEKIPAATTPVGDEA